MNIWQFIDAHPWFTFFMGAAILATIEGSIKHICRAIAGRKPKPTTPPPSEKEKGRE